MARDDSTPWWHAVLAVVVALGLGFGAGAYVEHVRARNASDAKRTTSEPPVGVVTTTTAAPSNGSPVDWFGTHLTQACPAIRAWYQALGTGAYYEAHRSAPWATAQRALQQGNDKAIAAIALLIPVANAEGKAQLYVLGVSLGRSAALLKRSTSAAEFWDGQQPLTSERLNRAIASLVQIEQNCGSA